MKLQEQKIKDYSMIIDTKAISEILSRDHTAEVKLNGKGDIIVIDIDKKIISRKEISCKKTPK